MLSRRFALAQERRAMPLPKYLIGDSKSAGVIGAAQRQISDPLAAGRQSAVLQPRCAYGRESSYRGKASAAVTHLILGRCGSRAGAEENQCEACGQAQCDRPQCANRTVNDRLFRLLIEIPQPLSGALDISTDVRGMVAENICPSDNRGDSVIGSSRMSPATLGGLPPPCLSGACCTMTG